MRPEEQPNRPAWPLIRSKLEPPEVPAGHIVRRYLLERLDENAAARLTLISAPAGHVRSTLVAQWIEGDSAPPAAWLSLDRLYGCHPRQSIIVAGGC